MNRISGTVLVVDDEASDATLMRESLTSAGFAVIEADDYPSALRVFDARRHDIDLLLADVSLPGRTGIDLARALLRSKPELKVLFISGHVGAEVIRFHGLPASDRHFLQKPFTTAELVTRVQEILESREPLDWLEPKKPSERRPAKDR